MDAIIYLSFLQHTHILKHIYTYTHTLIPLYRVFHVLPDNLGGSAIWAAQRVPDDHVAVVANSFIIGRWVDGSVGVYCICVVRYVIVYTRKCIP